MDADTQYARAMERLVEVVQQLSLARSLDGIIDIVRTAARALTGADGATFVLREYGREGDVCHYVDEDAIGPLWKGRRFPASACISGWAMQNRRAAAIDDIRVDPRIPYEAYAPTFVKSLVMVPIRSADPIGAIGCYWATLHGASAREVGILQALADCTSVAIENVEMYADLERRVTDRTAELRAARAELAAKNEALVALGQRKDQLAALVVHDIKGPAGALMLWGEQRMRQANGEGDRRAWAAVYQNGEALARLATNLLDVARSEDGAFVMAHEAVQLDALVGGVVRRMEPLAIARAQRLLADRTSRVSVRGDSEVLQRVLQNLVENALVHNAAGGTVRVDIEPDVGCVVLAVTDEGPGVPVEQRERIFEKYVRLDNRDAVRTGRGLGLAFCRLAAEAHGGRIWVEDAQPRGSRFCVRMPCLETDRESRRAPREREPSLVRAR